MRFGGILWDDLTAAPGLSITLYMQGCPLKCKGCHNPQLIDPAGGCEISIEEISQLIINRIQTGKIIRNLCIMGGEPLAPYNIQNTLAIIKKVKKAFSQCLIYIWTGYLYEELSGITDFIEIRKIADFLIDGPYVEELRNITISLRGSSNQRILDLRKKI